MAGSIITIMVDHDHPKPWMPAEEDLVPWKIFKKDFPDAEEAADVTVKLLSRVGVGCDKSARERILKECSVLAAIGYGGRIYPKITSIPEGEDAGRLFTAARGNPHRITRVISDGGIPQMRIALFRAEDAYEADPVLHYLNLSFSRHAQGQNSSIYQPQAFEATKKYFDGNKFSLDVAAPDELLVWIAMDNIRNIPADSPKFILSQGFMRLPARFYGNYNATSYDIHDAAGVEDGEMKKQACDTANWPFIGYGGIVAYKA